MCGICGIFRPDGRPVQADRVLRMRDAMTPRGPDGCGLEHGAGFALGHRRLSIIDLSSAGTQPMANEDGSVWIAFNGEIYNFLDLRPELEQAGHRFQSRTDTEVLIHGYETWGLKTLLQRIRGMYAFAIVDRNRGELHLARDPLGKKPLFYRWAEGELAFASSARALSLGLSAAPEVSPIAIDDLLWNRYIPGRHTIFEGVEKLPPGHALSLGRDVSPREFTHWQPDFFHPEPGLSGEVWLERLEAALRTAVQRRLVADVPIGVMLSGGVDSSLVTALAAQAVGRIKTFSVANEDLSEDESAYARAVSERYDTEHHVLPVRSAVREDLPRLVAAMGEPFADVSAANLFAIAELARQSVTVVLTGDGGDEGFGGYTEVWATHQADRLRRFLPGPLRTLLGACVGPLRRGPRALRRAGTFLHMATRPLEETFGELWAVESEIRQSLYTPELAARINGHRPRGSVWDVIHENAAAPSPDRVMQAHMEVLLPDDFLAKVDLATMAHSLEARCPFLDLDVIDLAMRVPAVTRFYRNEPKGLLRELARRHLPVSGVDRRKQGFTAPVGMWFQRNWRDLTEQVLLGPRLEQRGWFRRKALEQIVKDHAQHGNRGHLLWALLVLELWLMLTVDRTLNPGDVL